MRLELKTPTSHLLPLVQRAVDLVAFGLSAANLAAPTHLAIPDVFLQVAPAKREARSVEDARDEFRIWLLTNGFRDCIEGIGDTLEWVRRTCFLWTLPGSATLNPDGLISFSGTCPSDVWNEHIVKNEGKFNRLPLPDKFTWLESTYGWKRPPLSNVILGLNTARNCLVHRGGVVGLKDLTSNADARLSISWRALGLSVGSGSSSRIVVEGSRVEEGEVVQVAVQEVQRSFGLAERLLFTSAEFVEIATTMMFFARELEGSIRTLQESRVAVS